ncbi:ABC transporter ATP-binding protein/permease [Xylophilus ampelinus]|uniref:Putative ATP-binding cassette transporter n=1 Tax=Xylophilus ampelinus TaxID=54067 RepID=A0A318SCE0_9BURK|nr:ABC transporter ATP-binding protein/permease [Xylophilus ampelinus]MCS4511605.1 ABC transporter ATP-binding protein/permease [Xylophilus ampelinus]PYE74223.1 putative ATP-binding cassette transporter [Xylophilus ampelinus]
MTTLAVPKPSTWSLIRPYWTSHERWSARGLLLLIVAMNMAIVYINVRLNSWSAAFYDALQGKDTAHFGPLLLTFTALALGYIVLAVYSLYFKQMLGFRWRRWLTGDYLRSWLRGDAFYRIERDRLADNPDQRIADDLQALATTTLALSLDLLSTIVTLVSFVFILWSLAGPLVMHFGGSTFTLPGYMVWAAAAYAVVGSLAMQAFGRPLVAVNYRQQQVEANFRFGLVRVRENAEPIALYDGARTEEAHAAGLFDQIRRNWDMVMRYTKRLTLVSAVYAQIAVVLPLALAAPRYFAGAFSFGVLMQVGRAFGTVSDAMSWFISSYATLAEWRATVNRLREFRGLLDAGLATAPLATPATGIVREALPDDAAGDAVLQTRGLTLGLPNGSPVLRVPDLRIDGGQRWLISGPSGSGKSTLLRALAGLWNFGSGSICTRPDVGVLFVSQRSYLPLGRLRDALAYPDTADRHSVAACTEALQAVGLGAFADALDEDAPWTQRLSPGEQQRLAFARVLLQHPALLVLDEATSSLDTAAEADLYALILERLPGLTLVSIAHRASLEVFHDHALALGRSADPADATAEVPAPAPA